LELEQETRLYPGANFQDPSLRDPCADGPQRIAGSPLRGAPAHPFDQRCRPFYAAILLDVCSDQRRSI